MGELPDIQGLHAVSVLLVVANHLTGWPSGGFVGVDVFFVISGFVITATVVSARTKRSTLGERVGEFDAHRIRRLISASLVTLVATVGVALTLFDANHARDITVDGIWAGLFSASGHFIAPDTDYFAAAGAASPSEHFWSLSVEGQFYVLWPLLLLATLGAGAVRADRHRPRSQHLTLTAVLVVTSASLTWAWAQTASSPVAAYFSTFTRAAELAVGAALALILPRVRERLRHAAVLSWFGLAVIAASALLIGELLPDSGVHRALAAALVLAGASVLLQLLVERPFLQRADHRTAHLRHGRADVLKAAVGVVLGIRVAGASGCWCKSVVLGDADQDDVDGCRRHHDALVAEIGRVEPDPVLVTNTSTARRTADTGVERAAAHWSDALAAQLDRLPSTTPVALLEPAPLGPGPHSCDDAANSPVACLCRVSATHHSRTAAAQALDSARGMDYVGTEQWFCDTGTGHCPVLFGSVVIKHGTVHVACAYLDVIAPAARESFDRQGLFR